MTTYAINSSGGQEAVEIVFPGEPDRKMELIFIQPKSKAKLPPGARIRDGYLFENKHVRAKTVDAIGEYVQPVAPVSSVKEAPAPAAKK